MIDAFSVLGGAPTDSNERLQELLEEKELLTDDASEAQSAYLDLTNSKKRLRHEIRYFSAEHFAEFDALLTRAFNREQSPTQIAQILVEIGKWFETDFTVLLQKINEARQSSGHPPIEDLSVIAREVEDVRKASSEAAIEYFNGLTENIIVNVFNAAVKIPQYESFFIDELLADYEIRIKEAVRQKEETCDSDLKRMRLFFENLLFDSAQYFPTIEKTIIPSLCSALKEWDIYMQPLQVNMQHHGGQHEGSTQLIHKIREQIVDLANRSMGILDAMIIVLDDENYADQRFRQTTAYKLPTQLERTVKFLTSLIKLMDTLIEIFAELEVVVEQLKKDKAGLINLKDTVSETYRNVQKARAEAMREQRAAQGGCYIATSVYGSYDCPEVWVLRRYRDQTLGATWYGRLFIRVYYAVSPTLVKLFGKTKWFQRMWKGYLGRKIAKLRDEGFEDTPYSDIDWHKKKNLDPSRED